jgi:2-amino-4-hydroxy-6-hydroxymethyldihydropteridine diphosphokinase
LLSLRAVPEISNVEVSPLFETDPVGGPDQDDFLNAVAVIDTSLTPESLLAVAQRCEEEAGRERQERWGPRTLDVDVLAYDDVVSHDEALTLPHPRALRRAFVLIPWAAVDPEFVVSGRRIADWAAEVDGEGVRLLVEDGAG